MRLEMEVAGVGSATAATQAKDSRQAKLVDAAQQFEAMLLQQMLKPMQGGADGEDGGEKAALGGGETLAAFGTEAVARAILRGGGFGLARQIVRQVTAEHRGVKRDGGPAGM